MIRSNHNCTTAGTRHVGATANLNPHSPDNALSFGTACAIQI
jgi:hypothetical protein